MSDLITHSGIEAFLSICRSKSITRAAEDLFICQSSLSVRLKTLETELGTTLFSRKKGQREIVLTKSGKEFYEIALEYEKVLNKIEDIAFCHLTSKDVVRHPLVQKIVKAYEIYESKEKSREKQGNYKKREH